MEILKSASKIVLIIMAAAVVVWLFIWTIQSDQFMIIAGMVFTYYFSTKTPKPEPQVI